MSEKRIPSLESILSIAQPLIEEIDKLKEQLIADTITITEVIAPPFQEENRGNLISNCFKESGYQVQTDQIGNLLAAKDFSKIESPVIVSAHLDTVFPEEVPIKVIREADKLSAPGVGDDSRGLAVILGLARLVKEISTKYPILFVATVGEEGIGDLRGVKHLFFADEHQPIHPVRAFITIDGTGTTKVVNEAVGSKRYRVHFKGPGGHSYGAFGQVNPSYALASFTQSLAEVEIPNEPKVTHNIGVIGGGTSINSIPYHVWADIDIRSVDQKELEKLDEQLQKFAMEGIKKEMELRNGELTYEFEQVGDRPGGKLPDDSFLAEAAKAANRYFSLETTFEPSSTDANVPLSINVPAISVASVEDAGRAHSTDEWIDAGESSLITVKRNLLLLLLVSL
ncbi:MAG: M20/M25/M40 family metallo-hydrolase [Candidatus Kariarchaeaceae archaeon]